MPRSPCPKLLIALGFLLVVCGCGIDPETLDSLTEVINRGPDGGALQDIDVLADSFLQSGDGISDEKISANSGGSASAAHSFKPLYPDRENPFVYPADQGNAAVIPTSTSVAEIQVMGFANVQSNRNSIDGIPTGPVAESKVLLKTSLGIKSLAVGEQVGQITVLRIDSPTVELKMGSLIWTATMFDR